jgi:spermidine synthase
LSQVAENTVYTFALALAVYLLGTSCGAAAYAHWRRDGDDVRRQGRLLQLVSLACLLGMLSLIAAEQIRSALLGIFGSSMASALLAEALLAMLAFLLPTMMMGALFSHLSSRARARQIDFGRVLGVNTLGAAIAPIVFGVWLLPTLGSLWGLLVIATGYLALVSPGAWRQKLQWVTGLAITGCALWSPTLALIDVPPQGRLISHVEGTAATVSVVEDAAGTRRLHINNRQQEGSSATLLADARQALLPILLHPAPRRALFLGLGTGITALSATTDPDLQVDVVELIPEVIVASEHFTRPLAAPFYQSRLRIMQADARRFVRTTAQRYDLVISDNFHPARSGSGALYTVEHFRAVRARLNDDGIFCQWLPLHQLDLATLRSIVRAYLSVYPHAAAMLATNSLDTPVIGLIANNDATGFSLEQARARLSTQPLASRAASFGVVDELALLGSFIADSNALHDFAGAAPLNTDDHPIVIYQAPRVTYEPDSQPRDRLIELLQLLDIDAGEWLSASDKTQRARLTAYWSARNRFIEVGRDVRPSADVQLMLQQVREPLLDIVRISPDFRPAYDPLLQMARALATIDASDARSLLLELERLQPARLEATQLLRSLDATVTR